MRIIAFGDIHEQPENVEKINGLSDADCVIITGDLTNYGGAGKAKRIIETVFGHNPNLYAQHGNMDKSPVENYLDELGINLHSRGVIVQGVGFFGVGGSNYTPFSTPTEYGEEEIREFIQKGYEDIKHVNLKILVSHTPPYDTNLDIVGGGHHVGSHSVREFIEEYQPQVCLTGHIHEAVGKDRIGDTIILNPGMLPAGGYIQLVGKEGTLEASLKSVVRMP
ncbi:MAG: metallophosphoesterase [Desulfobacterales bacterium]|nr:metallophosphoesterase [Desulfobacterales bacterium]